MDGQRCLANPGGPADRRHHHPPAARQPREPSQLLVPAGETGHIPRQQTRHPGIAHARIHDVDDRVIPGRDHRLIPARGIHVPATARPLTDPIVPVTRHQRSLVPTPAIDDRLVPPSYVDIPACQGFLHNPPPDAAGLPAVSALRSPPRADR
jgi:hypothetical protein